MTRRAAGGKEKPLNFDSAIANWCAVSRDVGPALRHARTLAHFAVQPVGATGASLCVARPDDSHLSVWWDNMHLRFVGSCVHEGISAALAVPELALELVDTNGASRTLYPLEGKTLDAAYRWINRAFTESLGIPPEPPIHPPTHELPAHPIGNGGVFDAIDRDALEELGRWYTNAEAFCRSMTRAVAGASPVRCWPHHFDIATLITFDVDKSDPDKARSVGFGLSPGDGAYDEPYFYLNPWPRPGAAAPPALDGGAHWHTEGWFGAVLPASALPANPTDHPKAVAQYVESAWNGVLSLLKL